MEALQHFGLNTDGRNWKKKNQTIKTTKKRFKIDQSKSWGGIKYSDLQKKIRLGKWSRTS
jgi:hypothetical protein